MTLNNDRTAFAALPYLQLINIHLIKNKGKIQEKSRPLLRNCQCHAHKCHSKHKLDSYAAHHFWHYIS